MSQDANCKPLIRPEAQSDHDAVREITAAAFASSTHGHNGEADLVDRLRTNCDDLISLVAVLDEAIVGHVLFSPVTIDAAQATCSGYGLAPVSVHPAHQRAGIGSGLINQGLDRLRLRKCPFVFLIGSPDYYRRFGFQLAKDRQLRHDFDGIPQEFLMVNWLDPDGESSGTVRYREEFYS